MLISMSRSRFRSMDLQFTGWEGRVAMRVQVPLPLRLAASPVEVQLLPLVADCYRQLAVALPLRQELL